MPEIIAKKKKLYIHIDIIILYSGVSDPSTAFKLRHLTSSCAPVIITTPTRGHRLTINTITIGRFHRLPMWEVWHICRSYIGRKETSPKKLFQPKKR